MSYQQQSGRPNLKSISNKHLPAKRQFNDKYLPASHQSVQIHKYQNTKNNYELSKKVLKNKSMYIDEDYHNQKHQRLISQYFQEESYQIFTPVIQKKILYMNKGHQQLSIYEKSLRDSSAKRSWVEKQIKVRSKKQLQECTYRPKINNISRQITKKMRFSIESQRQYEKKKIIEEVKVNQTLLVKKNGKKLISAKLVNAKLVEQQPISNNIFQILYEDSKNRQKKRKKRQYELSNSLHQPIIDRLSKEMIDTKFEQRMHEYEMKKHIKHKEYEQQDKVKSMQLYKPKVGKPPSSYNNQNLPIGQYLYQQAKRKKNIQKQQKIVKITNKNSQKLYEKLKRQSFEKIFQILDQDGDGIISFVNINLLGLEKELFNVIRPLLQEIQMLDTELNQQEFIQALQNLLQSLSVYERNILLTNHKKKQPQKYKFQPEINHKSQQIVSMTDRHKMSVYQYCQAKTHLKQKNLEIQRIKKTKRQMENCTFHPKLRL